MTPTSSRVQNQTPSSKPFWQSGIIVFFVLLFFWPLGLYLMWKYTNWARWIKVVLSVITLIGPVINFLLLTFIWSAYFGIKSYSNINYALNPPKFNTATAYSCKPVNSNWGKCVYTEDNISFEYPLSWNYAELKDGSRYSLRFSPLAKFNPGLSIIEISITDFSSQQKAREDVIEPPFGLGDSKLTTINKFTATIIDKNYGNNYKLSGNIQHGSLVYHFYTFPFLLNDQHIQLTNDELRTIFYHMFNSFNELK